MLIFSGKPKDAGILPRALDVLFNSINGKQWPNNILKPKMFMDVTRLSEEQSAEEAKIKERTLKMVSFDVGLNVSWFISCSKLKKKYLGFC
jgi:kinesin family protein 20